MRAAAIVLLLGLFAGLTGGTMARAEQRILGFDELEGWAQDDHEAALAAFVKTCGDLKSPEWAAICALAKSGPGARSFFELFFRPVLIEDGAPPLVTGYFEPELDGALRPDGRFRYPVYRMPPGHSEGQLFFTRAEIEAQGVLSGRGLEIAWVDDPVELFFLQIQGSGRIRLPDGGMIRLGYAGSNGHNYRSVGEEMVRRGIYAPHQVSAQVIASWVRRNPFEGLALLRTNPSFVFFRVLRGLPPESGPLGAMNRPITAMRSIAVDPAFVPLGAPVWLEKAGAGAFRRLMIAQDTGSAIKGAQRADVFFGTGDAAGQAAGRLKDPGRLVVLMPIPLAFAQAEGAGK